MNQIWKEWSMTGSCNLQSVRNKRNVNIWGVRSNRGYEVGTDFRWNSGSKQKMTRSEIFAWWRWLTSRLCCSVFTQRAPPSTSRGINQIGAGRTTQTVSAKSFFSQNECAASQYRHGFQNLTFHLRNGRGVPQLGIPHARTSESRNANRSSCKAPVIVVRFCSKFEFVDRFQ
jgi:hypothetical protein